MTIPSAEPLQPGQRIELGIRESSLLGSALLVYMTPLFGLFAVAGLFQMLFHSDLAAGDHRGGRITARNRETYRQRY
ncbi:hypothetical protein CRX72_25630 [Pantoea sp. BRM17]|nr:hypothetical protein CRX72_25630 [Pantoea sp. BRM17]